MRWMLSIALSLIAIFVSGCNTKSINPQLIKQNPALYLQGIDDNTTLSFTSYKEHYFSRWNQKKASKTLKEVSWIFPYLKGKELYGSNLTPLDKTFLLKMREQINLVDYATLNKKAITLNNLNIRALPTQKPIFFNPKRAGEGFPFDYLQNSTISQNKPIFVTHYSKDKKWVHIESSFTYGWVKRDEIKFLTPVEQETFKNYPFAVVQKEGIAFYDKEKKYLGSTRFGVLFPIISEDKNNYIVLVATQSHKELVISKISKEIVHKNVLVFNKEHLRSILSQLLKSKYGWGGISGERDCSSTLRDFYAPFGLWLPRNSSMQAKVGKIFSLEGMDELEKKEIIKKEAVAFKTLLYMHGHILLYAGVHNGQIIVFQNMWGIRTKKDGISGRYIIGKALFTPIDFGIKLKDYDEKSKSILKIKSFNILF